MGFVVLSKDTRQAIERNLKDKLNNCDDFANFHIANSPRSMGDTVQQVLSHFLAEVLPPDLVTNFKSDYSRKAFEDVSFEDSNDNYYAVDIKTHNVNTSFNMPNITSVMRLAKFYSKATNVFVILFVKYRLMGNGIRFSDVRLFPIEWLKWECLSLALLGKGQIQIKDSNNILIDGRQTRATWIKGFASKIETFYAAEKEKIDATKNELFHILDSIK